MKQEKKKTSLAEIRNRFPSRTKRGDLFLSYNQFNKQNVAELILCQESQQTFTTFFLFERREEIEFISEAGVTNKELKIL